MATKNTNTVVNGVGAEYPSNMIVQMNRPLDDRTLVKSKDKLLQYSGYIYKGMTVAVQDDHTYWMLVDVSKASESDYSGWQQLDATGISVIPNSWIDNNLPTPVSVDDEYYAS